MADAEFNMLDEVKNALNITGSYQDSALKVWINDINQYMLAAGVDASLINVSASAGAVARGVADIWNYGAGNGTLSSYFYERVNQLSAKGGGKIG